MKELIEKTIAMFSLIALLLLTAMTIHGDFNHLLNNTVGQGDLTAYLFLLTVVVAAWVGSVWLVPAKKN